MALSNAHDLYNIGEFQLDRKRGLLLKRGVPITLRPKAFALLGRLAEDGGTVVSKSDLMDAVWPDVFVTEDSLTQTVRELRKAMDDDGEIIKTVPKRGYLLSVEEAPQEANVREIVVAVVKFANDGPTSDEAIIDGVAEDLLNALARFRIVTVLGRHTSFQLQSNDFESRRSFREMTGADYLITGRAMLRGETISASVSLIDGRTDAVLWNDRFVADGLSVFDMQHQIASKVVNRLVSRLQDAKLRQSAPKPTSSLAAYELLLRGLVRLRGYGEGDNAAARNYFVQAIELDHEYATAHSYLALTELIMEGYNGVPESVMSACLERAHFAVTLAPEEPRCQRTLGNILIQGRRYDAAEQHLRIALELNPFDADTLSHFGYLLTVRGRHTEAMVTMERALSLNPVFPGYYLDDLALAQFCAGDFTGSISSMLKMPGMSIWMKPRLAAAYAQAGNRAAASEVVATLIAERPDYSFKDYLRTAVPFEHAADTARLADGIFAAVKAWQVEFSRRAP